MKYYELDIEEEEILQAFEKGKIKQVANFRKTKKKTLQHAKNMLSKKKNINIRISESDLLKARAKAVKEGLPYQTLLASIVHKALV